MNELQIFAFVILPVAVVALGWSAVVLNERMTAIPVRANRPTRKN